MLKLVIVGLVAAASLLLLLLLDGGFGLVVGGPEFQNTATHGPMANLGRVTFVYRHRLLNTTTIVFDVDLLEINYLAKFVGVLSIAFLGNTHLVNRRDLLLYKSYISLLIKRCNCGIFSQILLTIIAGNDRIIANVFI